MTTRTSTAHFEGFSITSLKEQATEIKYFGVFKYQISKNFNICKFGVTFSKAKIARIANFAIESNVLSL